MAGRRDRPHYVIADRFFQAAFGGSFLDHRYLVAAQAPPWPDAPAAAHSVVDAEGFLNPNPRAAGPGVRAYPLHSSDPSLNDGPGGQWDHVVPPGQGRHATPGPSDEYGPSTRIPALLISEALRNSGVDHTSYDTTSILRTIERQYGLAPLDTRFGRDARVNDLAPALRAGGIRHG